MSAGTEWKGRDRSVSENGIERVGEPWSNQNDSIPAYYGDVKWTYDQPVPSIADPVKWYFQGFRGKVVNYFISVFPIATWIYRYNLKWLYGDLIAGITVGIVVVPQGMSYAKVAGLPVQYGLYSSFIGVMLYCFFATSKDVSIGPVAVMSSEVYKITHHVLKKVPELSEKDLPMIAGTLSLVVGGITLGLGVLRLGFLLEYIPMPAVLGFMTGSAFTIAVGQVPSLMGINKDLDTRAASYLVVVNTLKQLHKSNINAAFGLVCLFMLYFLKFGCAYLEKRDKRRKWLWFYLGTLRAAFVIIFSTLISWGCYRIYGKTDISMIKTVPRGLQDVGVHPVDRKVVQAFASELPIATVILVLEHIAISKSFGRINEYRINPNQELIAIGVSNMIGHFFQAYPNTGSFSRTALKSKCGVRTPLAGILTGACVLVAIYALTDAFYYISNAALAAIIIHAVGDLVTSAQSSYKFFLIAPVELLIFIVDVFLCVFVTLEAGIYFSVAASLVNLLLKQTFPLGEFLGKVEFTRHVANPPIEDDVQTHPSPTGLTHVVSGSVAAAKKYSNKINGILHGRKKTSQKNAEKPSIEGKQDFRQESRSVNSQSDDTLSFNDGNVEELDEVVAPSGAAEPQQEYTRPVVLNPGSTYTKWWPLSHNNVNPDIRIVPPPPGIFVYRFRESLTYQNAAWQTDRIVNHVREHTRRNVDPSFFRDLKLGDRPWNDPGPRHPKPSTEEDTRPILRAIVFDMSCSPNVDLTGAQVLWDCHQEVTKYARTPVEFHFAGILSPWSRRALVYAGFGGSKAEHPPQSDRLIEIARTKYGDASNDPEAQLKATVTAEDVERGDEEYYASQAPLVDTNNFYFHFDIPDLELRPFA